MSTRQARVVGREQEAALVRFLERHPDTTMFFRANLRKAGIVDRAEMYQGTYVGVFEHDEVVGAAVHYWNGDIHVECPVDLEQAVRVAAASSGREVRGFLGPWDQIVAARRAMGLADAAARTESREDLFALDLDRLRVPAAIQRGEVACRLATSADLEGGLIDWRLDFEVENLGGVPSERRRARGRQLLEGCLAQDALFVLERDGAIASMSAFNAVLPDCVQIGSVFTPPEQRSRGYARAVVAGSLLIARSNGVQRSLLFTEYDNVAARTAYRALGYERVGSFGLILYEK